MKQVNLTGKNILFYDDCGKESIMVRIPKFLVSDVIEGGPDEVHPAFIVNGKEKECIYVSKYQNVVENERAYSLPGKDPAVLYSIEEADTFCRNKGTGWHLMTGAEWAAVALWSQKNGTVPRGNNLKGKDWSRPHEHGTVISLDAVVPKGEQGPPMRIATGSGPDSWSHDGTCEGIFDLNGNIWEMTSGLRLRDGTVEIVENNDAALFSLEECTWRHILQKDASLTSCQSEVLQMTGQTSENEKTTIRFLQEDDTKKQNSFFLGTFSETTAQIEKDSIGNLMQQYCLIPTCSEPYSDATWCVTEGIRYPIRGGYWVNEEKAGIFAYGFYMQPDDRYFDVGFRCCYIDD